MNPSKPHSQGMAARTTSGPTQPLKGNDIILMDLDSGGSILVRILGEGKFQISSLCKHTAVELGEPMEYTIKICDEGDTETISKLLKPKDKA